MADTPTQTPEELAAAREAKKAADREAKAKKAAEKAARQAERANAQAKKEESALGPSLTLLTYGEHSFGNLFIKSETKSGRNWERIAALAPPLKGSEVWVRARVATSRKQGKALTFLQLRQQIHTVQAVVGGEASVVAFAGALPKESVVDVCAEVTCPDVPISSCSQQLVELQVKKIFCVSRSVPELPLQLEDAARPEPTAAEEAAEAAAAAAGGEARPRVNQDVRLNNRVLDLRTPANQAIMRIQSGVCKLFRGFLLGQGFTEIHSPKLVGTASEGGADVFKVEYFDRFAYLAQSPQLYKQMALMGDLERVFEVGPVFRSENSFTHRHMTEFVGLDMEMTFSDHYHEVLSVLEGLFVAIFDGLNAKCKPELEAVRKQFPFDDLRYTNPSLRLTFAEATQLLREHGPAVGAELLAELKAAQAAAEAAGEGERAKELAHNVTEAEKHLATVAGHEPDADLSTKDEKLLGVVVGRVKGVDFYTIDKFPSALRPFYTMPDPDDPKWSNSYDIFIRGEEVTSGAQRIHDSEMLLRRGAELGVDLAPIKDYVDSFKYGAHPHAGGGIGLERVVMLFLGLPNIRLASMFPRDPRRLKP